MAELENNPTQFAVGLKECGEVISVEYDDEQGNSPDFSTLPDPTCFEVGPKMTVVDSAQGGRSRKWVSWLVRQGGV